MKSHLTGWSQHGFPPESESKTLALLKPGIHNLCGAAKSGRTSIVADLAVALAAGRAGAPNGFFGLPVAAPVDVAIIPDMRHAAHMARAVEAAAFARGVTTPLPAAIAAHQPGGVGATVMTSHRLADLRDALDAPLRLVIFDEIEDADQQRARAAAENIAGSLGCAVLIVSRQPIGVAGVAFEIEGGALSMRDGRHGDGWRRAFSLDRVALAGGDDVPALRAGKTLSFTRQIGPSQPAPPPVVRGDEPKFTEKVVAFETGRTLTPGEIAAWKDYRVARSATDTVPQAGEVPSDGKRLIEIVPNDRDPRGDNARGTANRLRALADSRGVGDRVVIRISPRTVAAYAA